MRKTLVIVAVVVLAIAALGAGVAFAQAGNPPTSTFGRGMGMRGSGRGAFGGPVHDYVEEVLADKLGITEEQVEAELTAKPMYQIALDHGIAQADLQAFMLDVHMTAFAAAVADGVMTQEQADYMLQNMEQNGFGNCPMGGAGGRGGGDGSGNGMGRGMMGGGRWQGQ